MLHPMLAASAGHVLEDPRAVLALSKHKVSL